MKRAIVVGAGLSGSLLALYLARRGYTVDVFERRSDTRAASGERSALNITLCERGLNALEPCGLRDVVLALCTPARGRRVHGRDHGIVYQPYGKTGEAIYSVARSDLNDTLLHFAEREQRVRLHFEQRCVHIDIATNRVRFAHARTGEMSEVEAEVLFGADGAFSSVRAQMQRIEPFNYSQQYWDQGYKSLRVPPDANGEPVFSGDALHVWPRGDCMLIGFPNRDASTNLSLLLSYRGTNSYESLGTPADLLAFFRDAFADVVDHIPNLVEQFFAKPPNSLLTIRCNPWFHRGKILLVGDAAHAVLPSYGQGANAGFEDCRILDECISTHGSDFESVFAEFESRRRPSLDKMAELCVEHFAELTDRIREPGFLRAREIERDLHAIYPSLYQSLYSMITFTTMPYSDAVTIDERQRLLLPEIVELLNKGCNLHSSEVRRVLERSAGQVPT